MDRIWVNGHFNTGDKAYPACSAMYAKNGVIMAMGTDEEILALAEEKGGKPEICDLGGKYVLPGFVDSHLHILEFATQDAMVHLEDARSLDDVIKACQERVEEAKKTGKWVAAVGFNQDDWDVKKIPTRKDLDRVSTEVPVTIRRSCLHISVCNTKALEIMGFMDNVPEEHRGNCEFYEDGTPNGIVCEMSQFYILDQFPPLTKEDIKKYLVNGCKKAAAKGIVEIHSDDFHSAPNGDVEVIIDAYKELCEEGALPIHVYEQCFLTNEEILGKFLEKGHITGQSYGNYVIGPLKIVMDGSLGAHTAFMRKPYLNGAGETGLPYMDKESLYKYAKMAHDAGMQIATHCIGDAALDYTMDVYEQIQWENPRTDCRHGIVHCQIMDAEQQDRFRKLGTIGYVQPIFLRCDMNIVDDCVGKEIGDQSYNWRRFLDQGVHLSGGSDCPVEGFDVLENIQYAVTRTNFESGKSWNPEQSFTMDEALKLFTIEGAYASFGEAVRGSLSIGKEANMVVLDKDITAVDPSEISGLKVMETIVKGDTVYCAE